ncbi:hypothetical protein B4U84_10605 [Westiellopsis prolifica IICB1]|nr:hypothetical protein B4U84_10605 [Westiellopsis prolifica IICB1]
MKLFRYLSPVTTLSLCTVASLASITTATAQITPDSSLGAESSVVNPDVINGIPSDRIDGGATRGSNLFHSFQDFNIGAGRGAYFSNPANIANILTRVTGGNPSNILGRLGVLGNANLFLLNPKGIFFGPNASLDLRGGSFFGSTADSFIFNNNFEFSATNPQAVPLLTVNVPIGLRFRDNPGNIANQSLFRNANNNLVGLQVQPGNSLALVGGNINLSDGSRLTASGGSIELGGLATAGTVGLDITGNSFKLNFPTNSLLSDITISNARVQNIVFPDTTGIGGDINITTRNLSLTDGGQISASNFGTGNAGRVIINATGNISASGEDNEGFTSGIFSTVSSTAQGNTGGIRINTKDLFLTNGGLINASTLGDGNAGSVLINATGNISVSGESNEGFTSGIFSTVSSIARGNAGGIQINTQDLSLTNGGRISASNLGTGDAGRVIINAASNISVSGKSNEGFTSGIFSQVNSRARGNAGGIQINTQDLSLTNGGRISASNLGTGDAGSVFINATGNISAFGESNEGFTSGIFSTVNSTAQGNVGGIRINTKDLFLTNGGLINASTLGDGNAGRVIINATGNISVSGESNEGFTSGIFSTVSSIARGNAGGIQINTQDLSLTNGGRISASTFGVGNAGSVIINATGNISANGGLIDASNFGLRNAGGIQINTKDLSLTNGGQISAIAFEKGNAGRVIINATGNISVSGEDNEGFTSGIFSTVSSIARGNAGGIQINTKNLSLSDGGEIRANTFGEGNTGSVFINASGTISLDGVAKDGFSSGIFSTVGRQAQGDAGDIVIRANNLFLTNGAQISASTFGNGEAGNILVLTAKDIRLNNQASINAFSAGGGQGNIILNSRDLILRRNSNITAADIGIGTGGNIAITTGNLVALENSDIAASAEVSFGGNVIIQAENIFGTEFRERLTPQSDIVATGSVGLFTLNTQEVGQVLPELPQNPTDPTQQIAQNPCQKGSGSSFTVTGRGGLPSSPSDGFSNNETRVDLVEPVASSSNSQAATTNEPLILTNTNKPIIPAQGWIFNSKGEVVLTAYDPTTTNTAQRSSKPTAACPAF